MNLKPEIPPPPPPPQVVYAKDPICWRRGRGGRRESRRENGGEKTTLSSSLASDQLIKVRALLLSAPLFLKISVLPPHLCLHVCSLINFSVTMWQEFKCRGYSCQKPKRQICEKELTAPVHIVLLLTIFNAATPILWFQLRMMRRT